ncbi:hypothetical protein OG394_31680 [Kribbella sp. NBC_01245]|uniref:hypothetical protein n=1 Tax=Kribbella sp. NBC_01245 TaxID=2903578 RepID=UPI002E2A091B|nr:hypothetical protein [Kribbella sp. NBC_01245]
MSFPVNSEALSPDETAANELLAPFEIQIVRLRGEFTLRGNLTGLEAAYLHPETLEQIPASVVDEITAFGERRERLLAECLDAHNHPNAASAATAIGQSDDRRPSDPAVARNPVSETDAKVVYPPVPPAEVVAKCTAKVNAHYGLRNEGSLLDVLHRAKGPDAKLYESK